MQACTRSHENVTGTISVSKTQKRYRRVELSKVNIGQERELGVRTKIIYVPGLLSGYFTFHICMVPFLSGKPIHVNIKPAPFLCEGL